MNANAGLLSAFSKLKYLFRPHFLSIVYEILVVIVLQLSKRNLLWMLPTIPFKFNHPVWNYNIQVTCMLIWTWAICIWMKTIKYKEHDARQPIYTGLAVFNKSEMGGAFWFQINGLSQRFMQLLEAQDIN